MVAFVTPPATPPGAGQPSPALPRRLGLGPRVGTPLRRLDQPVRGFEIGPQPRRLGLGFDLGDLRDPAVDLHRVRTLTFGGNGSLSCIRAALRRLGMSLGGLCPLAQGRNRALQHCQGAAGCDR